jgi:cellulose synthase/poly-beta-1,6-N-acetylglucosamine synthase-like glycosyltransferase
VNLAFDLWIVSLVIFLFFLVYWLVTFGLTALSLVEGAQQRIERGELFRPLRRPLRPGISVIAAAYNEHP